MQTGIAAVLLLGMAITASGQSSLLRLEARSFTDYPVPGHHVDEFWIVSSIAIKTMTALMDFGPLNQVEPAAGSLSVFPTLLSPAEAARDSHFTFDISDARIISQAENRFLVSAEVEFNSGLPAGTFQLGRAVAANNHTAYNATVYGTFVDGNPFYQNIIFIPEPSVYLLSFLGFSLFWVFRAGASKVRGGRRHRPAL